jgi:hypothetical protein
MIYKIRLNIKNMIKSYVENIVLENLFFDFKNLRNKYVENFKKNKKYQNLSSLEILPSEYGKNYDSLGVFAKKKYNIGDLIELSPIIRLYEREKRQKDEILLKYTFSNTDHCKCYNCINYGQQIYVGLGYSSLYNSKENPNSVWSISSEDGIWLNIASSIINVGDEIFI